MRDESARLRRQGRQQILRTTRAVVTHDVRPFLRSRTAALALIRSSLREPQRDVRALPTASQASKDRAASASDETAFHGPIRKLVGESSTSCERPFKGRVGSGSFESGTTHRTHFVSWIVNALVHRDLILGHTAWQCRSNCTHTVGRSNPVASLVRSRSTNLANRRVLNPYEALVAILEDTPAKDTATRSARTCPPRGNARCAP
jgi:hypothetical protein